MFVLSKMSTRKSFTYLHIVNYNAFKVMYYGRDKSLVEVFILLLKTMYHNGRKRKE